MVSRTEPVEYVAGEEDLTNAVVTAISEAKDRDVTEDEPVLFDIVDLDSLDSIFPREDGLDSARVEFMTQDAVVEIRWNGSVTIRVRDLEVDPNHG